MLQPRPSGCIHGTESLSSGTESLAPVVNAFAGSGRQTNTCRVGHMMQCSPCSASCIGWPTTTSPNRGQQRHIGEPPLPPVRVPGMAERPVDVDEMGGKLDSPAVTGWVGLVWTLPY